MSDAFIGEKVAYWRQRRGKSQRVLADLAGISQPYLSQIENGRRPVERRATLVGLAAALEVSVAELTGQPGDPTDPVRARATATVPAIRTALIMRGAGEVRPVPTGTGGAEVAIAAVSSGDFGTSGSMLPALVAGSTGNELVRACYAAVWHLHYTGYADLAREAAKLAMAAAEESGDPTWQAVAAYVDAQALSPETADLAARLAARAATAAQPHLANPLTRQAYGMLHLTAAMKSATAGRLNDAASHLDEAVGEAQTLGDPDGPGLCWLGFGPTNVGIWRVAVLAELGDAEQAMAAAGSVQPARLPVPNRQARYWVDYGCTLASLRRDGEAVAAFLRAETISPQVVRLLPAVRDTVGVILRRTQRRAVAAPLRRAAGMVGLPVP